MFWQLVEGSVRIHYERVLQQAFSYTKNEQGLLRWKLILGSGSGTCAENRASTKFISIIIGPETQPPWSCSAVTWRVWLRLRIRGLLGGLVLNMQLAAPFPSRTETCRK
jgi:hypothetical protein